MRVLGLDISKHASWAVATEEGEVIEGGVFDEPDDSVIVDDEVSE